MMKKILLLCIVLTLFGKFTQSQTYSATLSIGKVDVSALKPGVEVVVPVKLVTKSGGMIAGFQFFIEFDHSLLEWKGTYEKPLTGVKDFEKNMPFSSEWLFNDNGNSMVAIWTDPKTTGVPMDNGNLFFSYIFTYKGGLKPGMESPLVWENESKIENNKVVKGVTEMYSEKLDYFILTKENGSIFMK